MIARLVDLARGTLASCTKKKSHRFKDLYADDPSAVNHDFLVSCAGQKTALCYTDGSASPNPGPSGAGATIFTQNPDVVHDLGAPTGLGTNNVGELVALGMCLDYLVTLFEEGKIDSAVIFSDSQYAIGLATSSKTPVANAQLVDALRKSHSTAISKFKVSLHWIRGHAGIGGNERADRISKHFSALNPLPPSPLTMYRCHPEVFVSEWWPSYPLVGLPLDLYIKTIPAALLQMKPMPSTTTEPPRQAAMKESPVNDGRPVALRRSARLRAREH